MVETWLKPTGRNIHLFLLTMNRIGVITGYQGDGAGLDVLVASWDDVSPFTDHGVDAIYFDPSHTTDQAGFLAAAKAAANTFATANSFAFSKLIGSFRTTDDVPAGLANAPQAAIANAPTDAKTDYNTLTTLLGTLTDGLNQTNTKQNAIGVKVNSILTELRALGLISS